MELVPQYLLLSLGPSLELERLLLSEVFVILSKGCLS
jgi:hypothetical protein